MFIEKWAEFFFSVLSIVGLIIFVPKTRIRDASVIFLFKLFLVWPIGLLVVEYNLVEYPVRFLANATRTSFVFEYLVFPSSCVILNMTYPEGKSIFRQALQYVILVLPFALIEVYLEANTQLVKYHQWSGLLTFITLVLTSFTTRMFYLWFRGDFTQRGIKI